MLWLESIVKQYSNDKMITKMWKIVYILSVKGEEVHNTPPTIVTVGEWNRQCMLVSPHNAIYHTTREPLGEKKIKDKKDKCS